MGLIDKKSGGLLEEEGRRQKIGNLIVRLCGKKLGGGWGDARMLGNVSHHGECTVVNARWWMTCLR